MTSVRGSGEEMVADLVDGGRRAVILDRDAVQHLRVGAAGADSGEVGRENLERLFHLCVCKLPSM